MEPANQKPAEPAESNDEVQFPSADPIENVSLPRTEPQVISGSVKPYRKLFIIMGILVLLAGMATGYILFR